MITIFKISIAIAILGAAASAVSLTSYFVRYSQHDGKLGLIPYDEYLELTRMTLTERYFFAVGSISFLLAAAVAISVVLRIRRRLP